MKTLLIPGVVAFLFCIVTQPVLGMRRAEPLVTVISSSDVIAVAVLPKGRVLLDDERGKRVRMKLTSIIKGSLPPGEYTLSYVSSPTIGGHNGGLFPKTLKREYTLVVFATGNEKSLVWRSAAHHFLGKTVEDGLLRVDTFGLNHEVLPDLVTLRQIKTFLKSGKLLFHFAGTLPGTRPDGMNASDVQLQMYYDAVTRECRVLGLPASLGSLRGPHVWFGYGDVTLDFSKAETVSLVIRGKVVGFDKDAETIETRFNLERQRAEKGGKEGEKEPSKASAKAGKE